MSTAIQTLNTRVTEEIRMNGSISEFSKDINDLSREVILEVIRENGIAWLHKVNPYGEEPISRSVELGEPLYNFCADFVTPGKNSRIEESILKKNKVTLDSKYFSKTKEIYKIAEEEGAHLLFWA